MRIAPALVLLSVGLLSLTAGCESTPDDEFVTTPPPPSAEVMTRKANQTKMDRASVPQAVRDAFAADFPGAAIDNVRLITSVAGESFYQITFVKNGRAQNARYFPNGATVSR